MSLTLPKHLQLEAAKIIRAYSDNGLVQEAEQIRRIVESPFTNEEEAYDFFESCYAELSDRGVYLPAITTHVQRQLINMLQKAAKNPALRKDANNLLEFLRNAHSSSWSQDSSGKVVSYFKLVTDSKMFEQLRSNAQELPNLNCIKACFVETPYIEQCRAKGLLRRNRQLFKLRGEDLPKRIEVFNWWNNLEPASTYYIFIPSTHP